MPADRDASSHYLPVDAATVSRIARPESIVLLAETVRAAREQLRRERIKDLKQQMTSGDGYTVPSKELAQRVLSAQPSATTPTSEH